MTSFESLGLKPELVKAVDALGFTTPTPIQEQAIPVLLLEHSDFVGLAQTGTGKTAAFGLPLLHRVDTDSRKVQGLILSPTRELCLQITADLENYSKFLPNVNVLAVYGGANIVAQIKGIKHDGPQVIIATPGRLIDLIERKAIDLSTVKYVVLDEADEMLNMGFRDDLDYILKNSENREATWLFSATMPNEVRRISESYMTKPHEITVGGRNSSATTVEHFFYVTQSSNRYETLKRLIDFNPEMYGIIFTRTKLDAQDVTERLLKEGYDIDALHGDLSQPQRDKVMQRFRDKSLQLLIATDVAARGIDVEGITHVINYSLPDEMEVYTHRSGRTGRAGKKGECFSIIHSREASRIRTLEKMTGRKFTKLEIPTGDEVCETQFLHFMERVLNVNLDHGRYESLLAMVADRFDAISKEEIIQRFASLEFNRFLDYYKNAPNLNFVERGRNERDSRDSRGSDRFSDRGDRSQGPQRERVRSNAGFDRIFVNVGEKDGFNTPAFLGLVLDYSELSKADVGRIDVREVNTFFDVTAGKADEVIKALNNRKVGGRTVRIEFADRTRNARVEGAEGEERAPRFEREPRPEGSGDRPAYNRGGNRSGGGERSERGGSRPYQSREGRGGASSGRESFRKERFGGRSEGSGGGGFGRKKY